MTIETKLQNGAEVFAEVKVEDTHWVAAEWHNGQHVTWKCDDAGNAYYGHYFDSEDSKREALADLLKRACFKTY